MNFKILSLVCAAVLLSWCTKHDVPTTPETPVKDEAKEGTAVKDPQAAANEVTADPASAKDPLAPPKKPKDPLAPKNPKDKASSASGKNLLPGSTASSSGPAWDGKAKIGMVITAHNRPEYLRIVLESLKYSNLKAGDIKLFLVDSKSDDKRTARIIKNFSSAVVPVKTSSFTRDDGVVSGALLGFDELVDSVQYLTTVDQDVYFKKGWVDELINKFEKVNAEQKLEQKFVLTGFNDSSTGTNPLIKCYREGKESSENPEYCEKSQISGVHYFFSASYYKNFIGKWLQKRGNKSGGWDWALSKDIRKANGKLFSISPSFIQHLGFAGGKTTPDGDNLEFATDF